MNTQNKTKQIVTIALMAALVFTTTKFFSIPIPVGAGKTALHLGNVLCILSGLLFGPITGGLAAGIGSMIVDLTDPLWAPEFWVTFIMKFAMGFVAGYIMKLGKETKLKTSIAGVAGALTYFILYMGKTYITQHFILATPMETTIAVLITKGSTSLTNALIAMVASVILYYVMSPALKRANLLKGSSI